MEIIISYVRKGEVGEGIWGPTCYLSWACIVCMLVFGINISMFNKYWGSQTTLFWERWLKSSWNTVSIIKGKKTQNTQILFKSLMGEISCSQVLNAGDANIDCFGCSQATFAGLVSRRESLSCCVSLASCRGVCVSSLIHSNSLQVKALVYL